MVPGHFLYVVDENVSCLENTIIMESIDVSLVLQHQIVRDGIKKIFSENTDINVKSCTSNITELADLPLEKGMVVILDLDISDLKVSELLVDQVENYPDVDILIIGDEDEPDRIRNIIKMGASGFMFKTSGAEELIRAVKTISEGQTFLCNRAQELLSNHLEDTSIDEKRDLEVTKREREVLVLICKELTNREIAEQLNISVRTVDAHRRNLLQKTEAKNTAGMVKYAIRHHIYSA